MKRLIFCLAVCLLCGTFLGFSSLEFSSKNVYASGSASNILMGIAAVNKNDVWAAGESATTRGSQTLLEHWNGHVWSVVSGPVFTGGDSVFEGVAASSSRNVWAVGGFLPYGGGAGETLIEHWNGRTWKVIPSPNPAGAISSFLNGVAITGDSVWAVGTTQDANGLHPLIERWDDGLWRIVSSPDSSLQSSTLQAVSAVSKNDLWAVGSFVDVQNQTQALIEHWNGAVWTIVPGVPAVSGELSGVSAIAKDDVWSVGNLYPTNGNPQPMIEHWNGNVWQAVDTGSLPASVSYSVLNAVSARAEDDAWAVGYTVDIRNNQQGLVEHWNGKGWEVAPAPALTGSVQSVLQGVAVVTQISVWAAGETIDPANHYATQPLLENWDGEQLSVVSSPKP